MFKRHSTRMGRSIHHHGNAVDIGPRAPIWGGACAVPERRARGLPSFVRPWIRACRRRCCCCCRRCCCSSAAGTPRGRRSCAARPPASVAGPAGADLEGLAFPAIWGREEGCRAPPDGPGRVGLGLGRPASLGPPYLAGRGGGLRTGLPGATWATDSRPPGFRGLGVARGARAAAAEPGAAGRAGGTKRPAGGGWGSAGAGGAPAPLWQKKPRGCLLQG